MAEILEWFADFFSSSLLLFLPVIWEYEEVSTIFLSRKHFMLVDTASIKAVEGLCWLWIISCARFSLISQKTRTVLVLLYADLYQSFMQLKKVQFQFNDDNEELGIRYHTTLKWDQVTFSALPIFCSSRFEIIILRIHAEEVSRSLSCRPKSSVCYCVAERFL